MIGRISLPEGELLVPQTGNINVAMAELALNHVEELVILEPEVYDITPRVWTKNTQRHELAVLDNGEGLLRMRPKVEGAGVAGIAMLRSGEISVSFRTGGRTTLINESQPKAAVSGGRPDKKGLHVFEMILYLPPELVNS